MIPIRNGFGKSICSWYFLLDFGYGFWDRASLKR